MKPCHSLTAASRLPTTAPSTTVATAATIASNDDVDESLEVVPSHFMCPIAKLIMTNSVSDPFGHSSKKLQ
jgi:hypothetical protein